MKRSMRDEVVSVKVGDITAQCPHCGEIRFRRRSPAGDGDENPKTVYSCLSCRAAIPRLALLEQIGDEAIRRAKVSLKSMRKRSGRAKKGGSTR
jgi:hypothetical protein